MPFKGSLLEIVGASTVYIGGVTRQSVNTGTEVKADTVAGSAYPVQAHISKLDSRATFTTHAIAQALTICGATGLGFPVSGGTQKMRVWEIEYLDNGTIKPGSVHRALEFKAGRLVPRTLSCASGENATLELELVGISDGATDGDGTTPTITILEGQAAPTFSHTQIDNERFALGKATVGNFDLGCITNTDIDFGIDIVTTSCTSNPYPTLIEINRIAPMITLSTRDLTAFKADRIKLQGVSATAANTKIYLRKRKDRSAEYDANATTSHIAIGSQGLLYVEEPMSADGNANATASVKLQALWDGTNAPIALTVGSAIT